MISLNIQVWAREEGLNDAEIGAVLSIVMAVSAGRMQAQLKDAGKIYE